MEREFSWEFIRGIRPPWDALVTVFDKEGDEVVRVAIEFKMNRSRRYVGRLQLEAASPTQPITTRLLRRLPLGAIESDARRRYFSAPKSLSSTKSRSKRKGSHRGKRLSDDHLQRVSEIYRSATVDGQPVSHLIAREFRISTTAAAQQIAAARRRGFLGPALVGKTGEAS